MMDDLISRQAAIDALGEEPAVWVGSDYEVAQKNQWNTDKLAIETVPSASQWIPCSERLPEKCGVYLVSGSNSVWLCELVQIMTVYGWANDVRKPVVTAWMPLPEPYKGEEHDPE